MKVQCNKCGGKFTAPEEKIPKGKSVRIPCPKCGRPILLGRRRGASEIASGDPSFPDRQVVLNDFQDEQDDETLYDVLDEGTQAALVAIGSDDIRGETVQVLQELGFHSVVAESPSEAIGRIARNTYAVILTDEGEEIPEEWERVLQRIRALPMDVRRRTLVCLFTNRFKTRDAMAAFRMQVDVVIHYRDRERLKTVLQRALREKQRFYSMLFDSLKQRGEF